jgi:hypothetical protein
MPSGLGQLYGSQAATTVHIEWVGEGLLRLAGGYGSLSEAEHVGTFGVFGAAVALVGWQCAIGVNLSFEPA